VKSPIGKISWVSLCLVAVVLATIVVGILVPGRTGTVILVVGLFALGLGVIFEVGLGTVGLRNRNFNGTIDALIENGR
jgi:hypothetical protein